MTDPALKAVGLIVAGWFAGFLTAYFVFRAMGMLP